jgi:hypothetical protein
MTSWHRGHSIACSIDMSAFVTGLLVCLSSAFSNWDASIFDVVIFCQSLLINGR